MSTAQQSSGNRGGVDFPSSTSETRKVQSFCVVAKKQTHNTNIILQRNARDHQPKPTKKNGCFDRSPRKKLVASIEAREISMAPHSAVVLIRDAGVSPRHLRTYLSDNMPQLGIGIRERRFLSIPVALKTAFIGPVGSSLHSAPLSTSILDLELYDTPDGSNAVGL